MNRPDDYLRMYGSAYRSYRAKLGQFASGERMAALSETFLLLTLVVVEDAGAPPPIGDLKQLAMRCGHGNDRLLRAHLPLLTAARLVLVHDDGSWSTPLANAELARRSEFDDSPSGASAAADEGQPETAPPQDEPPPDLGRGENSKEINATCAPAAPPPTLPTLTLPSLSNPNTHPVPAPLPTAERQAKRIPNAHHVAEGLDAALAKMCALRAAGGRSS